MRQKKILAFCHPLPARCLLYGCFPMKHAPCLQKSHASYSLHSKALFPKFSWWSMQASTGNKIYTRILSLSTNTVVQTLSNLAASCRGIKQQQTTLSTFANGLLSHAKQTTHKSTNTVKTWRTTQLPFTPETSSTCMRQQTKLKETSMLNTSCWQIEEKMSAVPSVADQQYLGRELSKYRGPTEHESLHTDKTRSSVTTCTETTDKTIS